LPLAFPRPARQRFDGDALSIDIDARTSAALRDIVRQAGATSFAGWLAVVASVLGRQAAVDDIVLGVPVANRTRPEAHGVVGFFLNTLPLRLRPRAVASFETLVRETREALVDALDDAEVPFEAIVDAVKPPRDLSYSPIFQVLVTHLEADDAPMDVETIESPTSTSQFDLGIHVRETASGARVTIEFATALFARETVEALGDTMRSAIVALVQAPASPLGRVGFVSDADRAALRTSLKAGDIAIERRAVVERVDAMADTLPDRVAVTARTTTRDGQVRDGAALTYRALLRRAAAIARALDARALPPESLIVVALDREPDFLAACLGIWRAGHAVLPIDLRLPDERVSMMIEDARPGLVIGPALDSRLSALGIETLDLRDVPQGATPGPRRPTVPASLAYVL